AAARRGGGERGRGARADLSRQRRGRGPRPAGARRRLESPPRRAGGRRAHAARARRGDGRGGAAVSAPAATAFRSGFAALVGRPNVGKSTLLNALVGQKISIVTPRPQTTRHRILGISNLPAAQIAWVDTPGLHREGRRALNKAMNRTATAALADADIVVLVVEAPRWEAGDDLALARIVRAHRPAILAVNKIDRVRPRERLLPYMATLGARHDFLAIV